jgi:biopolymer transport protein TolR
MAMSTGGGGGLVSDINVTPLVDVMLVLLVIFMVTTPLIQTEVPVALPQANADKVENDQAILVLTIRKEQDIYLGKSIIANCPGRLPQDSIAISNCIDEGVRKKLEANAKVQADHQVYIHADEALPYGFVVKVMAAAKAGGAEKLGMVTEPLQ